MPHSEKRVRGSGDDSQTASDGMVFFEELLKIGTLDLLEHFLEGHPLDEGQIHIGDLLAVTQFDRCIDQAADIIGAEGEPITPKVKPESSRGTNGE